MLLAQKVSPKTIEDIFSIHPLFHLISLRPSQCTCTSFQTAVVTPPNPTYFYPNQSHLSLLLIRHRGTHRNSATSVHLILSSGLVHPKSFKDKSTSTSILSLCVWKKQSTHAQIHLATQSVTNNNICLSKQASSFKNSKSPKDTEAFPESP